METEKATILIVDDTLESLQVLSNTLLHQGYRVRGAARAKMALRTARASPPDLILLDIRMPEMNGYEVCECLKADEQTRSIPVIFISALDEAIDKVKAFQVGGVDYISKPFHVEEVLARIEHQLMLQRLSQQLQTQNQQLQQEIQERKKAEEVAASANRAKSEFLANMSHELRTPLNAILGFTQLLTRDSLLNCEQRDYIEIINRNGEHLLELINDVLEFSKIEAGRIILNKKSFDLYRLLDNLEEVFQIKTEPKGLVLQFMLSPDVPQYIQTDEQKLRSCLLNLLSNAIKFTNYGSITITVEKSKNQESHLQFSVRDTGVGIAPNEIDTLFDAFVQTSAGMASAEGTGLGLAITKKFVQILGGEITVNSVLGEGTTFQFTVKFADVGLPEIMTQSRQRVIGLQPEQESYRILIVDDAKVNRLLLVKLLEPIGFEVQEAANGSECIALWESWHPHLILLDTRMPVMGGLEATQRIRAKEREMNKGGEVGARGTERQIRAREVGAQAGQGEREASKNSAQESSSAYPSTIIIALTASVFEERRGEILAAGSNDFLRKPFSEDLIFEKIRHHLGVLYQYEELPHVTYASRIFNSINRPDSFFLRELAGMPDAWLNDLYESANKLREESVFELIEQIPGTSASLAIALNDLANDFRLDEIVRLTQTVINSRNYSS